MQELKKKTKDKRIIIRTTKTDLEAIQNQASKKGLTLSAYILGLVSIDMKSKRK
jgi:predicted DNA binding CopG/RHH family protein